MYPVTIWVDETDEFEDRFTETMNDDGTITHTKRRGVVYVEGTPQDAAHFNNLENGVYDAHAATALLVNALRQAGWRIEDLEKATVQETGTVTLTNSQSFPFNNSIVTVPLTNVRDNLYYIVEIISVVPAGGGNAGEIVVSERQVNGFKMAFTGSASSVAVTYAVIGGYDK
jgi:hypothetical protein